MFTEEETRKVYDQEQVLLSHVGKVGTHSIFGTLTNCRDLPRRASPSRSNNLRNGITAIIPSTVSSYITLGRFLVPSQADVWVLIGPSQVNIVSFI